VDGFLIQVKHAEVSSMRWFFVLTALTIVCTGLLSCRSSHTSTSLLPIPEAVKRPVVDEYHGVKVTDDYRWLENSQDPAVRQFVAAQNQRSRAYFDQLTMRQNILSRLKELHQRSASYYGLIESGGLLFAMKDQPPKNHSTLVTLDANADPGSERLILDPEQYDPRSQTAIDWFVPSLDGKLVAVSLSEGGSEDGSLHLFETATGKKLPDIIPRVQFATGGGDVAWNADGSGFWYTRYPQGDERPPEDRNFYQQVYFHRLATPSGQDSYVIGAEFPRIAEITLQSTWDGRYLLASVANGDGGEFAHYLMNPAGRWTQVTQFADKVIAAVPGEDGNLYLLSRQDASRGKLVALPLAAPRLAEARTIIPAGEAIINSMVVTTDRLFVVDLIGGPHQVRIFDLQGGSLGTIPLEPVSAVRGITPLADGTILYNTATYIDPPAWRRFDPRTGQSAATASQVQSPADFSDTEVVREFAISKDGTQVPLNIIRRKGLKLDGRNPLLLYGYGGYSASMTPGFSDPLRLWIEQGGVYVVANLRGGGEFGEEWHLAGNLLNKQNVFDDFAACARHLIDRQYTSPERLAIRGGSNGGLLMGAAMVQHPEMFRAVVSQVGIYDMLRVELSPNGAFNVTEFGTVKDPEQFKALYAYSPYHHVVEGTRYPAVFMTTGDNDGRVDPMQSRKMIARLQAATSSRYPVLLQTSSSAGHGQGTSLDERLAQSADIYAFLFDQLGMEYQPGK
jgi:prolyl oligopeptidase